ncbi:MAG TPA: PilN domain-containing protein [Candidatus Saccharimonadales bacterium]|nr:PilN domain-containing protein [Candidatus Saccharimonadales bacterium]
MSKVQLNLLPDTKLEFNKAQHTRRLVTSICVIVSAVSLAIFIILFVTVDVLQKAQMNSAGKDVDQASSQLKNTPKIGHIITVQSQLSALSALHQSKHIPSRIYTYLSQLTPTNATINHLDLDLSQNTLSISGQASDQASVNAFVNGLKEATYTLPGVSAAPAFPSVVESGFSITSTGVGYTLTIQVDPKLFTNTVDTQGKPVTPKLTVKSTGSGSSSSNTLFTGNGDGQ